jgi:BirA family biotin operon repressor/biotin-[acetyl-CoA-carboxylase] ligase
MISPLVTGPWLELDETESTQEAARALLASGEPAGVVFAHHQTRGRGRFERSWHSQRGESLTMSLVFGHYADHPRPWLIGMAVAIAAAGAAHSRLMWPNDLMLDGKKLGGILTELIPDSHGRRIPVVGVGINVGSLDLPTELADRATSLALHRPGEYSPTSLAREIVARISDLPEPTDWPALRAAWMLFDATPGKRYLLASGEEAVAIGLGPTGELLCSVDGETRSVLAAEAMGFD